MLPPEIWNRPKRPYRAPIHHQLFPENGRMPWVRDILSPEK
ncbi:MAG: asparagine synthase C-terminal domain-containing protein [Chloroflexi bacterium]|nr:asparagine synthase C-terminal domain-containing protein [Chloroflexota bacterium]